MDNNNSKKKDEKSSIEYDIDYDFISGEKFDSSEDELTFNDTQSVNNSTDRSYSYDFTEGIPASAAAPTSVAKPAEVAAPTNSAEPATAATTADDISSNVESPENNIDIDVNDNSSDKQTSDILSDHNPNGNIASADDDINIDSVDYSMKKKSDAYKTIKEAEAEAPNAGKIEEEYIKKAVDEYTQDDTTQKRKKNKKKNEIWGILKIVSIAFAAAFIILRFIVINAQVPTGSMKETINENDRLFGFRLAYVFSEPQQGDVIIFKFPDDESKTYIKRVIGTPGDTVKISAGAVYVNGEKLDEPYLKEPMAINSTTLTYTVPDNCYFVMGDNRNNSYDSRYWTHTYVSKDQILAKALFKYFDGEKNTVSFSGIS